MFACQELQKQSLHCVDGEEYTHHQIGQVHCRDIQQDIQVDVYGKCAPVNELKKPVPFVDSFLLKSTSVGLYVDTHVRHIGPHAKLSRQLPPPSLEPDNSVVLDAVIKVQSLWRQRMAVHDAKSRCQAIVKLQRWMKAVSVKRQQRVAHELSLLRKTAAARSLQRCFRKKRHQLKEKVLLQAIVFAQSRYRMVKAMKLAKARRNSITVIAKCFKTVLQVKEYKKVAETQIMLEVVDGIQSGSPAEQECQGGFTSSIPKKSVRDRIKSFMKKFMKCCFTIACTETKHEDKKNTTNI